MIFLSVTIYVMIPEIAKMWRKSSIGGQLDVPPYFQSILTFCEMEKDSQTEMTI